MKRPGGIISRVEAHSLASRLGLQPGDELLAINGHKPRDIIDVQFYGAEDWLELLVRQRDNGDEIVYETERVYAESLGLDFVHPSFDVDIRRCRNNCLFCFLSGNPRNLRQSLYLRDDDYRYSFLYGNFVTLTNLLDADWERLAEQHLSPLYISVHATELALRRQVLGRADAPDVLEQLRRLAQLGIRVHTQLVLVPGFNDGPHLERSLKDLAQLAFDPVLSVGIVPVGLTRYHPGSLRPYQPHEMAGVMEQVSRWQERFRQEHGSGWVYASDEWYLALGCDVPPSSEYDGYPQIENGIGMVRRFLDEWEAQKPRLAQADRSPAAEGSLVCGTLIARTMVQLAKFTGLQVQVLPVENRFFGPTVTVSGLLTGQDVVATLKARAARGSVFLPRAMFDAAAERTLDDWTPEAIAAALDRPVLLADSLGQVVKYIARDAM